jgi:hypothetical protein
MSPNVATPLRRSVRMTFTLPKWGLGSPSGLPKTQSSIARVKTPCLEMFFILLQRSWNVDVENGLAWVIWTSAAQVMCERRARSQIGNLTPNHKKSGIDLTPVCVGGVQHTVEKLSRRATSLLQTSSRSEVWKELWAAKVPGVQTEIVSGLLLGSPKKKCHWDVGAME